MRNENHFAILLLNFYNKTGDKMNLKEVVNFELVGELTFTAVEEKFGTFDRQELLWVLQYQETIPKLRFDLQIYALVYFRTKKRELNLMF